MQKLLRRFHSRWHHSLLITATAFALLVPGLAIEAAPQSKSSSNRVTYVTPKPKPIKRAAYRSPKPAPKPVRYVKSKSSYKKNTYRPPVYIQAKAKKPVGPVQIQFTQAGAAKLASVPVFDTIINDRVTGLSTTNDRITLTLDPKLQAAAEAVLYKSRAPHVAIVAMDPYTGRILALADRSQSIKDLALHPGFPAASLFKVVTSAAAIDHANIDPDYMVKFRGGTYTLNRWNATPDNRRDTRRMTLVEALGRSCNVVFSRIATTFLPAKVLEDYANSFGFNREIPSDLPLPPSHANIPFYNTYEFGRTAAGFGDVRLTPVHAAMMMSGIANGGFLPQPSLIDSVVSSSGNVLYRNSPRVVQRSLKAEVAHELLQMMEATTTMGTSKRAFFYKRKPVLGDIRVAGKTGTLNGDNPAGLNNWFIGAAPIENPLIAVAVVVVNSHDAYSASKIGRMMIEEYLVKR